MLVRPPLFRTFVVALTPPLLALLALLAIPAGASAAPTHVAVGVGDQSPQMFDDPNWQALRLAKTRYVIEWNAMDDASEVVAADKFVTAARRNGVKVFMQISADELGQWPPSVSDYKSRVQPLFIRYKEYVDAWGVWRTPNDASRPTSVAPKRAAQFYRTFRSWCARCKIVALDVRDQEGVERYIERWFAAAGEAGRHASILGIQNYDEVNRRLLEDRSAASLRRFPGTARIIKTVRKHNLIAQIWYTETGGVVQWDASFPCDRERAANRTEFMFNMIRRYDGDVERLYAYNWFGTGCTGFDAGLVEEDGTPRPAYSVFEEGLVNTLR